MLADDEEKDGGSVNVYGKLEAKKNELYSKATTNKSLDEKRRDISTRMPSNHPSTRRRISDRIYISDDSYGNG